MNSQNAPIGEHFLHWSLERMIIWFEVAEIWKIVE